MIKRSIKFSLEKRKKNGEVVVKNVPIRCTVTFNRQRIIFFTGHRIDASKFIAEKGVVKNGAYNEMGMSSSEINFDLEEMRSTLQNIFHDFEMSNIMPTVDDVKDKYNIAVGKKQEEVVSKGFFDVYKDFIEKESRQKSWAKASRYKHNSIMHMIEDYDKNVTFDDWTEDKLLDLMEYMRNVRGIRNTTLNKNLRFFKQFLSWAADREYHHNFSYKQFKPRLKGANFELKKVIYLTMDELMHLYTMQIEVARLDEARDVFCFCCFSGLRYSDVFKLKKNDIINNKIEIVTKKDIDNITIELNKFSKSILDKYADRDLKGKALPVISNQKYNDALKDLGKLAKFNDEITLVWYVGKERREQTFKKWEILTTHVARKTFTVNSLALGIPTHVIMRWLGHSDLKTMKPYMHIVDKLKEQEMSKFDDL